jgi:hypothetical protein
MRSTLLLAWMLTLAAPAAAQHRPVRPVPDLTDGALASLLLSQRSGIERCAARSDASSYVANVQARVSPGSAPATLYHARIAVSVTSRPRDPRFEGCVRRMVRDALREAPYAVGRSVRASQTFQIAERHPPPLERPPAPYDPSEVQRLLTAHGASLQQCLGIAGIPERLTLRVSVRPDGRLVLTSADLPPGVSQRALGCLSSRISGLRVNGRPARAVNVTHRLAIRARGW